MVSSVAQAFLFGVTLAVAIGPIALLILTLAASDGLRAGSASGAGAALADGVLALVAYLAGAAILHLLAPYSRWLAAVGGAVLLVVGLWCAFRALRAAAGTSAPLPQQLRDHPLTGTCALTLANPLTLVLFAGFAPQLALARAPWLAVACGLATGLGSLLVQLALAAMGAILGRLMSARIRRWLTVASGFGIALFGIAGLWASR